MTALVDIHSGEHVPLHRQAGLAGGNGQGEGRASRHGALGYAHQCSAAGLRSLTHSQQKLRARLLCVDGLVPLGLDQSRQIVEPSLHPFVLVGTHAVALVLVGGGPVGTLLARG